MDRTHFPPARNISKEDTSKYISSKGINPKILDVKLNPQGRQKDLLKILLEETRKTLESRYGIFTANDRYCDKICALLSMKGFSIQTLSTQELPQWLFDNIETDYDTSIERLKGVHILHIRSIGNEHPKIKDMLCASLPDILRDRQLSGYTLTMLSGTGKNIQDYTRGFYYEAI